MCSGWGLVNSFTFRLKTGYPRAKVLKPIAFLWNRIIFQVPSVKVSMIQNVWPSVQEVSVCLQSSTPGEEGGELKLGILPWSFGLTHASQTETSSILKINVLWPDWRYAVSYPWFYYLSAHTHTHTQWFIRNLITISNKANSTDDKERTFKPALCMGAGGWLQATLGPAKESTQHRESRVQDWMKQSKPQRLLPHFLMSIEVMQCDTPENL